MYANILKHSYGKPSPHPSRQKNWFKTLFMIDNFIRYYAGTCTLKHGPRSNKCIMLSPKCNCTELT